MNDLAVSILRTLPKKVASVRVKNAKYIIFSKLISNPYVSGVLLMTSLNLTEQNLETINVFL